MESPGVLLVAYTLSWLLSLSVRFQPVPTASRALLFRPTTPRVNGGMFFSASL